MTAGWTDTFTLGSPTLPPGSLVDVKATVILDVGVTVNSRFSSCPNNPRARASITLATPRGSGSYTASECASSNGGYTQVLFSYPTGVPFKVSSGLNVAAQADAYWNDPDTSSTADASDTARLTFDVLTPGATYTTASGNDYRSTPADSTAPTTAATLATASGPYSPGAWANQPVTVSLSAADEQGGSGVRQITYSAAGAQPIPATAVPGASTSFAVNAEGSTTVSYYATDNAGNAEAPHSVTIRLDRTPPAISCAAADGQWHGTDATIACTATDGGSGLASPADARFDLATSVPAATETADAATGARQVCDAAGNCATAGPVAGNKVDKQPPAISGADIPAAMWRNTDLAATFTASDGGSGLANAADASFTLTASAESADASHPTVASRQVCDAAGNCATRTVAALIDKTPPTITLASRSTPAGVWTNADVTLTWTCMDSLSGVVTGTVSQTVSTEGANQAATATCTDNAGNATSDTQTGIDIDKTPPTITPTLADNSVIYLSKENGYAVVVNFTASDALSPAGTSTPASQTFTATALGTQAVTVGAQDAAGNATTQTFTYTVRKATFLSPLTEGASNTFKVGSTIPVKLAPTDAVGPVADQTVTVVVKQGNLTTANETTAVTVADSGLSSDNTSTMRYDATCACYIYNLSTKTGYSPDSDYTIFLYIGQAKVAAIEIHASR